MVYAHKVNTTEELLQLILSAARNINNAAVLRRVTSSLESEYARKQTEDTLSNLLECRTANL